ALGPRSLLAERKQWACSPHRPKMASECLQIRGLGDEADKYLQVIDPLIRLFLADIYAYFRCFFGA
ncbi:hypothetical protein, partial [Pseudomonas juntendi]|uniref:hypothetical protein n=1 Tax=Pseudomonas juntendi TaxID=2666183 RepID=UPI001F2CFDA8